MGGSMALGPPPPPPYNSEGFLGWSSATPSFLVYRSLVWLCAVAPFHFLFVQAPGQNQSVVLGHLLVPLIGPTKREHLKSEKHKQWEKAKKVWAHSIFPR